MHGFLNLNKPSGWSSRQVVDAVGRCFRQAGYSRRQVPKLGHVGTLDPLATGVLVIAGGQATRLIDIIHSTTKTYRGTFQLGRTSRTDDIESDLVDVDVARAARLTQMEVESSLAEFRGLIEQVPPQFSAVHVAGQRAYELARRGTAVELKAKHITIHRLELLRFEPPEIELEIECSSGTYIRSLGRDLGERLRCGAVMSALTRTRVGPFQIEQAISLEQLVPERLSEMLPCRYCVTDWPTYVCDAAERDLVRHGRRFEPRPDGWRSDGANSQLEPVSPADPASRVAMIDLAGELLAIGDWLHATNDIGPRINLLAGQQNELGSGPQPTHATS